jgi:hypothetical protein
MRTNNGKVRNIIVSVYFILIVLAIILATVFSAFKDVTDHGWITFLIFLFGFAGIFFLVHWIAKFFEYDSDGVKVVVLNKGLLLTDYVNYREYKVEFEKERLAGFKFHNYIVYKSLVLSIKNKSGNIKHAYFNVTLIDKKKRKYIKQSLMKMLKENRKKVVNQEE